jgi:hypothetical protein
MNPGAPIAAEPPKPPCPANDPEEDPHEPEEDWPGSENEDGPDGLERDCPMNRPGRRRPPGPSKPPSEAALPAPKPEGIEIPGRLNPPLPQAGAGPRRCCPGVDAAGPSAYAERALHAGPE